MEWLQTLLDNSTAPALTAFLLGLLTAISPCPLATNIAAIGYISKDIENRRRIFLNGVLYTIGRVVAYTVLGIVLISILKEGASVFGIQKAIGKWGELLLGPLLVVIGLFMLFGHKINLPQFGFGGNGEGLAKKGGWGAFLVLDAIIYVDVTGCQWRMLPSEMLMVAAVIISLRKLTVLQLTQRERNCYFRQLSLTIFILADLGIAYYGQRPSPCDKPAAPAFRQAACLTLRQICCAATRRLHLATNLLRRTVW